MQTTMLARNSVFGLVRNLTAEAKTFIRQEVQLAKTEISEKISLMGRNAASLAIGGFVAYAGVIVFLIGLGSLLAYVFVTAGLQPFLAGFVGFAIIGLLVAGIGYAFVAKALKTFSTESFAPQKTLHTLQELRGNGHASKPSESKAREETKLTTDELETRVEATEGRMGETLDELRHRLSPQYMSQQVTERIQANPYRAGLIAMGVGVVGGLIVRKKLRRV